MNLEMIEYENKLREQMLKQAKADDKIVMQRRSVDAPHARHIKKLPSSSATAGYVEDMRRAAKRRAKYLPFLRKNPGAGRKLIMRHFKIGSSAVNAELAYLWRNGLIRIERPGRGFSHYYAKDAE